MPGRHWLAGRSVMVVSIISAGAGSVAESNRPSLPATEATSGVAAITWSCQAMMRLISLSEVLGTSTGMKSRLPSCSVGMNSVPKPDSFAAISGFWPRILAWIASGTPNASTAQNVSSVAARPSTVLRWTSAQSSTGS